MTVVPPGEGGPGEYPEPYVPSGLRRSTFTPAPTDADQPAFDDDALADALAAQVATYTSPIPVTPSTAPVTSTAPAREPEPASEPEPAEETGPTEHVEFAPAPPVPVTDPSPVTATEPAISPTLEAIERLESELRRRAAEAAASSAIPIVPPAAEVTADPASPDSGPVAPAFPWSPPGSDEARFPEAPTYLRPAPPEDSVVTPPPVFGEAPAFVAPPVVTEPPVVAEPPVFTEPPALVEPPAPRTAETLSPFAPPPAPPTFAAPPASSPVDLPPPAPVAPTDFAHLPPPVGLEPAALPPYVPSPDEAAVVAAPLPDDVDIPLGTGEAPRPHPDDLGGDEPPAAAAPVAPGDDDDVVDDVDRAFGTGAIAIDSAGAATVLAPPSQPIPTARLTEDEVALVDESAQQHPALLIETAAAEPTALDLRAGRAARLFWLWFAANSSVISLSLGAVLFGLGVSLRQALVAILIGVALSFLPLGLGTLAGKWTGQPTMIVSRAAFGVVGNVAPAIVAVLSRVFWGGALLWLLGAGVGRVLADAGLDAGLGEIAWSAVALGVGGVLVLGTAIFGYGLLARVQLVLSILTAVLVVGLIVITAPRLDLAAAQSVPDGPWVLLVSGVVLVFSFVGLAWVHASGDLARYQRPDSDGGSTMLWATFGATLPAFALLVWGALLAASDPLIADGLASNPLYTIAALLPAWYPAPLLAALGLGLLSGAVLTVYSGGFALQAVGVKLRRPSATAIAGVLVIGAAVALLFVAGDARGLIRDVATTIAVPVAAWAGIFAAEMMIRRSRFDADSLLRRGGLYPAVRWTNLVGFVVITALGFGFTSAALPGLDWQGFLLPLLGLPAGDPLLTSDVGVLGALLLGILLPLVTAVPAIRRQERALVD